MENNKTPVLRFPEFKEKYKKHYFKELFEFSTGKNIKQAEASPSFKTPCIRYGELYHMYDEVIYRVINKTNIKKSELIFSEGNEILLPSAGEDPLDIGSASALMLPGIAIGRTINVLKPLKANIYSSIYASFYINHKLKFKIARLAKGVSISNVYNSDLRTLSINLPSISEQQKIASFLSSMDKRVSILERKKTKLEEYKKGIMQKIFSQEYRFKDEDGNDFPKWEEKRLGEITDIIGGGTPSTLNESFWNGTINWFTPSEIKSKYVNNSLRKITEQGLEGSSAKLLPINTILFTSRATLGDVSITNVECTTNQGFQSFVPSDNYCTEFLYYWILMNRKKFIRKSSGSTFMEISKTEIQKINILLPVLAEQERIASFLAAIDTKIEKISAQIEQTKSFKKGLLQQMFV